MLRGLWKVTWIELKIFLREPLGAFGTIVIPVLVFIVAGRIVGRGLAPNALAVPDDRRLGTLRASRIAAAVASRSGESCAANLRRFASGRDLEGRRLVGVGDLVALALVFIVCTALSAKVFRWE
jgi:hypothetical protein